MKNLITIILFIFISNLSFSQPTIRKAGDFYELNDLWKRDSISVKKLMDNYKIDTTNLTNVKFFDEFDLNVELHEKYSYTGYSYVLYKTTGVVTMKTVSYKGSLPSPNKYVMVFCFDDYVDKKIINIKIF